MMYRGFQFGLGLLVAVLIASLAGLILVSLLAGHPWLVWPFMGILVLLGLGLTILQRRL